MLCYLATSGVAIKFVSGSCRLIMSGLISKVVSCRQCDLWVLGFSFSRVCHFLNWDGILSEFLQTSGSEDHLQTYLHSMNVAYKLKIINSFINDFMICVKLNKRGEWTSHRREWVAVVCRWVILLRYEITVRCQWVAVTRLSNRRISRLYCDNITVLCTWRHVTAAYLCRQLRKAYFGQVEELQALREQLSLKEKRIRQLEDEVQMLRTMSLVPGMESARIVAWWLLWHRFLPPVVSETFTLGTQLLISVQYAAWHVR